MAKKPVKPVAKKKPNKKPAGKPALTHGQIAAAIAPRAAGKPKDEQKQRGRSRMWQSRVVREGKVFDVWSKKYECDRLESYYLGDQWRGLTEEDAKKKYCINLVFATVETQLPSLLFSQPKVEVEARPDHEMTPGSDSSGRATLIQQMLQTFVDNPRLNFLFVTTLALREAYWRFGVVEVGYTADWIDNPNAGKPVLKDDKTPLEDEDGPVLQPKQVLKDGSREQLYVKQIPARAFRCSPGRNVLTENDWYGYYEYHYVEDLKANKAYQNTENLGDGTSADRFGGTDAEHDLDPEHGEKKRVGMAKVWKIWDLRSKNRIVFAEGQPELLQEDDFTYAPHQAMKFYEIGESFYPCPPLYNWLSPQDEINEQREQAKIHRRRFNRRYMVEPQVDVNELEKLETGGDGTAIKVPSLTHPPIMPVADADMSASVWTQLAASHDDFNQITGVGGEARGMPEADTATQANIINVRAQVRESRARQQVADFLAGIVRLMLLTIRESMTLPMMVKRSVDTQATGAAQTAQRTLVEWLSIKTEDIDELEVDINIDVASLSPVAEDAMARQWNIVLTLLKDQALLVILMTPDPMAPDQPSPLLKKTLNLNGVKSDQEVRTIWRILTSLLAKVQAAATAAQNAPPKPEPMKISLALKGEDLSNPLVVAVFKREEMLMNASQVPANPMPDPDEGGGTPAPATPVGPTTGTPAVAGA